MNKTRGQMYNLLEAISDNDSNRVRELVRRDASIIDDNTTWLNTPLIWAVMKNNQEMVRLLVELGADIQLKNKQEQTPLIVAIKYNNRDMVRLLVELKADINIPGSYGYSPLRGAILSHQREMIKLLIELGANIDELNKYNSTPLLDAISLNEPETVKLLIELGADVEARYDSQTISEYLDTKSWGQQMKDIISEAVRRENRAKNLTFYRSMIKSRELSDDVSLPLKYSGIGHIPGIAQRIAEFAFVQDNKDGYKKKKVKSRKKSRGGRKKVKSKKKSGGGRKKVKSRKMRLV